MKYKYLIVGVVASGILGAFAASESARGQFPGAPVVSAPADPNSPFVTQPDLIAAPRVTLQFRNATVTPAIDAATAELRDATTDEKKTAARKKLADLLAKYFDEDMKGREAELKKVEERVKKLRGQYDKRASKKQEIVDLQLKVLENDADGLGFFKTPTTGAMGGGGGMYRGGDVLRRTPAYGGVFIEAEPQEQALIDPSTAEPARTIQPETTDGSDIDVDLKPNPVPTSELPVTSPGGLGAPVPVDTAQPTTEPRR